MSNLLIIESSPRGENSISRNMTTHFINQWQDANLNGKITQRDLTKTSLPFITADWLNAYFTPPENHTPEMKTQLAQSDELVNELLSTDHLVISTPVYNYNVPANLKSWIDHIIRKGMTLGFDGNGLVKGKKATVLLASGGVYTDDSPIKDRDIATQYLKLILNVIGFVDVVIISGGGAKAVDLGEIKMDEFINTFEKPFAARAN